MSISGPHNPFTTALLSGVALATLSGCGTVESGPASETDDTGSASASGGTPSTGAGAGTGGAPTMGGEPSSGGSENSGGTAGLPPIPESECVGEDHGDGPGYYGRCCPEVSCREPGADGQCLDSSDPELYDLPGYPPGSGSCACNPTVGPFAADASEPTLGSGPCCYVIYSIICDGRPLRRQDASWVLAPVVERNDWLQA